MEKVIVNTFIVDYKHFGDTVRNPCYRRLFELKNGDWYIQTPTQNSYLMKVTEEQVNKALADNS